MASDLAQRLVNAVARQGCDKSWMPEHKDGCEDCRGVAKDAVVAVLRELVERPRHGGPHMYCRSEGELRGLVDELEEQQSRPQPTRTRKPTSVSE